MSVGILFVAVGCVLFGFVAGLLTFRVKSRWCVTCGSPLDCLACTTASQRVSTVGHRAR